MRQMRRKTEDAIEAYLGKLALLNTYEEMGIHDEYTRQLAVNVRKRRVMLVNRGALD